MRSGKTPTIQTRAQALHTLFRFLTVISALRILQQSHDCMTRRVHFTPLLTCRQPRPALLAAAHVCARSDYALVADAYPESCGREDASVASQRRAGFKNSFIRRIRSRVSRALCHRCAHFPFRQHNETIYPVCWHRAYRGDRRQCHHNGLCTFCCQGN